MQQTITIARAGWKIKGEPKVVRDEIDADVRDDFAIHETIPVGIMSGWTVTHVPTGWSCLTGVSRRVATMARNAFIKSGLDWSFTDPKALTAEHKAVGSAIKRRWGGK